MDLDKIKPEFKVNIKSNKTKLKNKDIELLRAINKYGSINKASKKLGRSFSRSQKRIVELEKNFGELVKRYKGGKGGGGSELTKNAKKILNLHNKLNAEFTGLIESEMTTWNGEIKRKQKDLTIINTPAGKVYVSMNKEIPIGKKVQVLIRADSVILKKDTLKEEKTSARNTFKAKITKIKQKNNFAIVELKIKNEKLKAIITKNSLKKMNLQKNNKVIAKFKATSAKAIPQKQRT